MSRRILFFTRTMKSREEYIFVLCTQCWRKPGKRNYSCRGRSSHRVHCVSSEQPLCESDGGPLLALIFIYIYIYIYLYLFIYIYLFIYSRMLLLISILLLPLPAAANNTRSATSVGVSSERRCINGHRKARGPEADAW